MHRLATSSAELKSKYDVVVVGSGYGGGVAASRLARAGLKVCVLERGREILPGEFPGDLPGAQKDMQLTGQTIRTGADDALFNVRLGDGVHAVTGCGLGGTSLINANVCLMPTAQVLADPRWPRAVREDHWLSVGFHRARGMLQPKPLPVRSRPPKLIALEIAARTMGRNVERVPLHIAFEDSVNQAGVVQPRCTECGDCMGGCNVGAKTTVHSTYLTDAVNHGAELFTGQTVRSVERLADGLWRIRRAPGASDANGDEDSEGSNLIAKTVVLAAGTLGSSEILMRSRENGLQLSDMLGKGFTTNADSVTMGYNNDIAVNGIGVGHPARAEVPNVGPAVIGLIDLRSSADALDQLAIVEASVQSAMAPLLPSLLGLGGAAGESSDPGLGEQLAEIGRGIKSVVAGAYTGAVHNTQTFLAVGNDSASGEIRFVNDRAIVHWPDAVRDPIFSHIDAIMKSIVAATGGTYLPNPAASPLLGGNLMTVHPLGGCAMGEDRLSGVVDHKCRVFDGSAAAAPDAVFEGLYVCDGSVLPRSVGVHPLLTITAIAERAMIILARDRELEMTVEPRNNSTRRNFVTGGGVD